MIPNFLIVKFLIGHSFSLPQQKAKLPKQVSSIFFYEVIEYILYTNLTSLFIPETHLDVIWDMIIGMAGGLIIFFKKREKKNGA